MAFHVSCTHFTEGKRRVKIMDRFAYLRRLVETNSMLMHHLEDHILGMVGTEKETAIHEVHEDMVKKYLAAMKEVHSGLECFLIFNKSQELQNVIHGLNLQFPRMGSPIQYTTLSKYPNVILQHEKKEEEEAMIANLPQVKEEPVILSQSDPLTVQTVLPPPPPPPLEKKKKRKSKRDLLPPPLDMKKIKEEEEKMRTGHGQPVPQVPPTPCNDTLDLEQFFHFLPITQ